MRSRILPAVGISALALVAAAAFAPMASANHSLVGPAHKTPAGSLVHQKVNPQATCYAQLDNDNGIGVVSQNFEPANDGLDSQGADDFTIGAAGCKVKTVHAVGVYFNGAGSAPGPAKSFNVTFYKGKKAPGAVIKALNKRSYTDASGLGDVKINLGTKGPKLGQGHYWVSVQANLDFTATTSEWGWNTNNTQSGKPSKWQNPNDGFATGCTTYKTTTTCIPAGEGPDFSFAIIG